MANDRTALHDEVETMSIEFWTEHFDIDDAELPQPAKGISDEGMLDDALAECRMGKMGIAVCCHMIGIPRLHSSA